MNQKAIMKKMEEMGIDTSDPEKSALLQATMAKLDKILTSKSTSEVILDDLHPLVRARVEHLQKLQDQYDEIEDKYVEEQRALILKYEKLYEPLYAKRAEVVNGGKDAEIKSEKGAQEGEEMDEEVPTGVPDFWACAMRNSDVLDPKITDKDMEVLKYLTDVKYELLDDAEANNEEGFKLYFHFKENPYFDNKILEKTYIMLDDEEEVLEKSKGTVINWKPGKNVTVKVMRKKTKKGSKKGNAPPITKTEKCNSFFNFFDPPDPSHLLNQDEEDIDEEEMEELQDMLQDDYELGCILKDRIIPNAVSWFTGDALDDDDDDDDDDDMDGSDDYDDEDDDADEEDTNASRAQSNSQANTSESAQQPECKQQ